MRLIEQHTRLLLTALYFDDSNCLVLDLDDVIIFVGENRLADFGVRHRDEVIGQNIQEVLRINHSTDKTNYFADLGRIKRYLLANPDQAMQIIVSAPFGDKRILHLTTVKSIYDDYKSVIGCIIEAKDFSLSNINRKFELVQLTTRQEEIMFLLAIGFSQKEIADIYAVQRGTIIKNIGVISEKLGINGASTDKLTSLVFEQGYGKPPYHLLKTGIFPINSQFITTSFFRTLLDREAIAKFAKRDNK